MRSARPARLPGEMFTQPLSRRISANCATVTANLVARVAALKAGGQAPGVGVAHADPAGGQGDAVLHIALHRVENGAGVGIAHVRHPVWAQNHAVVRAFLAGFLGEAAAQALPGIRPSNQMTEAQLPVI
jgi:hypothetical protein